MLFKCMKKKEKETQQNKTDTPENKNKKHLVPI